MSGYIIIPATGQRIYDGTIVILQRLPDLKWIVHYGFYIYQGVKSEGWYLVSIPEQVVNPFLSSDLAGIRVVDYGPVPQPIPPFPPGPIPPFPPFPPGPIPPGPGEFTPEDRKHLNQSMLTVQTIEDRDALIGDILVDGKVCRVNEYEGHIEYFQWSEATTSWQLLDFGPRVALVEQIQEQYVTKDELTQDYITKDQIAETYLSKEGASEIYASKEDVASTYASKQEVAETYASKEEVAETYASKAEVAETYPTKAEVSETYATKEAIAGLATVEAVEEVSDELEQLDEEVNARIDEIEADLEWLTLGG